MRERLSPCLWGWFVLDLFASTAATLCQPEDGAHAEDDELERRW